MIGRVFWRTLDFLDRLIFCRHDLLNSRGDDGSLRRVCGKCGYVAPLLAKHGNVIPLAPPKVPARVIPLPTRSVSK